MKGGLGPPLHAGRGAGQTGRFAAPPPFCTAVRAPPCRLGGLPVCRRGGLDRPAAAAGLARWSLMARAAPRLVLHDAAVACAGAGRRARHARHGRRRHRRSSARPAACRWSTTARQPASVAIDGLGDLSHAAVVFSRDARYAYVFGRDGGLTKVDLLRAASSTRGPGGQLDRRRHLPGRPAGRGGQLRAGRGEALRRGHARAARRHSRRPTAPKASASKVVGLADAPGDRFVFSLFEAGEIWVADALRSAAARGTEVIETSASSPTTASSRPTVATTSRACSARTALALLDLWQPGRRRQAHPRRLRPRRGEAAGLQDAAPARLGDGRRPRLPARDRPARGAGGRHGDWKQVGRIPVHGQPVFVMARPDGRQVWVNFAFPDNDTVQVIDCQR